MGGAQAAAFQLGPAMYRPVGRRVGFGEDRPQAVRVVTEAGLDLLEWPAFLNQGRDYGLVVLVVSLR